MKKELVTSLKLSKELKELGVKQESEFAIDNNGVVGEMKYAIDENDSFGNDIFYSAFLSGELGMMLPEWIEDRLLDCYKADGKWECSYNEAMGGKYFRAKTEAEARGEMLAYLIKNKLLSPI